MKRLALLLAALLLWPTGSQGAVKIELKALATNNIAVLTHDGIELLDRDFDPLGERIELAPSSHEPSILQRPIGNILVAQDDTLREFNSDGAEVRSIDGFDTITDLALGPGGEIVITTVNEILLFDLATETITRAFDLAGGVAPRLMPRVVALAVGPTIKKLELASGATVGEFTANGETVQGMARRADGAHAVLAGDQLFLYDADFQPIVAPTVVPGGGSLAFLPSGNLLVTTDDALVEFDGATLEFIRQVDVPGGFVVDAYTAPHVFEVKLEGQIAMADGSLVGIKAPGLMSWRPGSGRVDLTLVDQDAVAALGENTLVLRGFEAGDGGDKGVRLVHGIAALGVSGAVGAEASGFIGKSGSYTAESVEARLEAARDGNVLMSSVKTTTLVNP